MFFSDGDGVSSCTHRCSCEKLSGSNASSTFYLSPVSHPHLPCELELRRRAREEGRHLQTGVVGRVETAAAQRLHTHTQRVEVAHEGERAVDRQVRRLLPQPRVLRVRVRFIGREKQEMTVGERLQVREEAEGAHGEKNGRCARLLCVAA